MHATLATHQLFPFLLGRAFIEANGAKAGPLSIRPGFPFLFGRAFIEEPTAPALFLLTRSFSLPFRKGFHRGDGYVANNGYVWFIFLPIRRGFL